MSEHSNDELYHEAKRAKTTKNVYRCYDCEQVFHPIRKGQKFCTKCRENRPNRPINAVDVDHNNPGKKKSQCSPCLRKPSVLAGWKLEPIKFVSKIQPNICPVPNSSLIGHLETNSLLAIQCINLQMETASQTLTGLKDKEVAVHVKENISSSNMTLGSQTTTTKNCPSRTSSASTGTARKSTGIPLAVIDLSISSCDESNNDDKEKQDLCHPMLLSKSSNSSEKSTEFMDPDHLTIQNVQQTDFSNLMLDFSNLELDDLRVKEEELKEIIIPYTVDSNEISSVQKRITELESRHSAEKEILYDKEGVVKSFELQIFQTQCVLEAFAEERNSLCIHVKKAGSAVELARSSCDSTEMGVHEIKRKLEESKDEVVKDYLHTILARKVERAKDAEAKAKYTVSQLDEAEKDLEKTERDLKSKEVVHHEMLVQVEEMKSELMTLHDICNSTNEEIKLAHAQLKSLMQANNKERFCKYFELKRQLLEIECKIECLEHERKLEREKKEFQRLLETKFVRKSKELDAERESRSRMLSLTP